MPDVQIDIIREAERIVDDMFGKKKNEKTKQEEKVLLITTSQIRKFLAAVNKLENRYKIYKNEEIARTGQRPATLPEELVQEVKLLEIKLLYQVGREKGQSGSKNSKAEKMEIFYNNLKGYIRGIGDSAGEFEKFCRLMEAITAFHKFKGGGE